MSTNDAPRPQSITADIVASVISIETEVGAEVAVGETLLVMESMKMEIPITATTTGTVSRIGVAIGDVVQEGDLLVEIRR